jgi:hypothetical protein
VSNLASEAEKAGNGSEARAYRLAAIGAHEQHLLSAARAQTQYYRDHFPNSLDRVEAGWRYVLSRLNGVLWGYGERGWPLLRSVIVITLLIWPVLFQLARGSIENSAGRHPSYGDCVWLSLGSLIGNSGAAGFSATDFARGLVLIEGAIGLLLLGLFVTYIYRYVIRR